ncbi:MAG TPA: AraC family transcriptional regulator [Anaerovoracaceae bacterium]|nr:AraC family transcriptional regulator [Anaerovoracaceae bacterium]
MLFEKITYSDDFPINITIANIDEYPVHYHQDIEFVYVLKGEVNLKNGYCTYTLKEGDIFTNSGHEVHRITSNGEDNVVALIQISTHYFSQYFPTLSRACYRTYSNKASTKKHDNLREKLLQILLQYSIKSFNYKNECTYLMVDVIKYLEKVFNLFAFEGDVVINFESGSQVTIERISHIINYIYQYYREKITLEDLAEMEHLSTFYLSHIIKNCTGMSFREFLCFARVEWSEIDLLDTNKKISQVANDVGFSTTAYYEKHFQKWFKRTPADHRKYYMPLVKSEIYPERIDPIPANRAIALIKSTLSSLNSQKNSTSIVSSLKLEINVDASAKAITYIEHLLDVQITYEDFVALGYDIFSAIGDLHPAKVTILVSDDDTDENIAWLQKCLENAGFNIQTKHQSESRHFISYGCDSIAFPIYLFSRLLRSTETWIPVRLRDYGDKDIILKGISAAMTSGGVRKPAYYAYQALSLIKGDIIYWGKQYCVVRSPQGHTPMYCIIVYNFNDQIYSMCAQDATLHQVKNVLNDFKDEIDFNISLDLNPGMYSVMKYSISRNHNAFTYLSSLDFADDLNGLVSMPELVPTAPSLDVYMEDVRTSFNINFSLKGAGIQLAAIRLKGDSKSDK